MKLTPSTILEHIVAMDRICFVELFGCIEMVRMGDQGVIVGIEQFFQFQPLVGHGHIGQTDFPVSTKLDGMA